ncbi:hypothetical protein NMY22_g1058 [Coprinellus aureogranulatus]|nr:hypothetical protein NMY22_g1058 [Coprinellus aureogranulatus]
MSELPDRLVHLADALHHRFDKTRNPADIDEAVYLKRKAVELTPEQSAQLPQYLISLGNSLLFRNACCGNLSDIDEAVDAKRRAIQLTQGGREILLESSKRLSVGVVPIGI